MVSLAENKPDDQLTVLVTREDVLVQGRVVASVASLSKDPADLIAALKEELDYRAARKPLPPELEEQGRPITIVGDKGTAYAVLKKVMNTCSKAGFNNISLAVNQLQPGGA